MLKEAPEDLVMGKTLAAWIMVAGAVAAPAMSPRETVESAVGRVITLVQDGLVQDSDTPKAESIAADRRIEIRKLARQLQVDGDVLVALVARAFRRHLVTRAGDRPPTALDEVGGGGMTDAPARSGDEDRLALAHLTPSWEPCISSLAYQGARRSISQPPSAFRR